VITGVHHFALTVSNADRSTDFYRGFGFEIVADREVKGGYVEEITGVEGAHLRLVHLSGYGHNLELLEYRQPRGEQRSRAFQDVGSAHICLLTDDLDADFARLCQRGVVFRSDSPVTTTSGPNQGGKGVYALDPDGNAVEIVQLARPWGREDAD
jgi:catechol 2,3-dioxygenase-like lactoylglutathione lyase family enzyme